jgi:hypothetical protein
MDKTDAPTAKLALQETILHLWDKSQIRMASKTATPSEVNLETVSAQMAC